MIHDGFTRYRCYYPHIASSKLWEVDQGKRTDQQRFYDQLDIAFLVLGYVHRGARITKAERQHKTERDHAITLPNKASNLVPSLLMGSFPGF